MYNFTTKPANGADGAVSFVWYGDMGVTNSQDTINAVSKLVADDEIDRALCVCPESGPKLMCGLFFASTSQWCCMWAT